MISEQDAITRLRAARDAVLADAPEAPDVPTIQSLNVSRLERDFDVTDIEQLARRRRAVAVPLLAAVIAMVLVAVGLSVVLRRDSSRNVVAADPAAPYMYSKSSTQLWPGERETVEAWFPVSGVGRYMTKVTRTGTVGWARKRTPDGRGVFVYRSTCYGIREQHVIKSAPYYTRTCPIGPKTPKRETAGSGSSLGSWERPTPMWVRRLRPNAGQLGAELHAVAALAIFIDHVLTHARYGNDDVAARELRAMQVILTQGGYLPHKLSNAFEQVAASIPGVHVKHGVKNLDGRIGTEYWTHYHDYGQQKGRNDLNAVTPAYPFGPLIFDSRGRYIGTAFQSTLANGKPAPFAHYGQTSFESGTAYRLGGKPAPNR